MSRNLEEIIKTRRSTRSFLPKPLPQDVLERIVEAGRYAPSGNNNQTTRFIVITSPEKLLKLRGIVTGILASTPIRDGMPAPLAGLITKAKESPVDVNYGASALVVTTNRKGYANNIADCACALMNMMLMASEAAVGSCWINQYRLMGEAPPLKAFMRELGMREDEEVCGALALGYPEKLETEPLPRNGNPVEYVM
jgi:nitroreductase